MERADGMPGSHGLDGWLRRNLWEANAWRLLLMVVVLALLCVLLQNILEWALDLVTMQFGLPGRIEAIKAAERERLVSPLLVAPVVENAMCWVWLRVLLPAERWAWWKGPLVVAMIAAGFHVLLYRELSYFSVVVDFFAICGLILNVEDRIAGFWASVLLHGAMNLLVLLMLLTFGF